MQMYSFFPAAIFPRFSTLLLRAPVFRHKRTVHVQKDQFPAAGTSRNARTFAWRDNCIVVTRPGNECCHRGSIAKKLNGEKNLVYSLHGDGELQEAQLPEAMGDY